MEHLEHVDTDRILSGDCDWMGTQELTVLSTHPLDCIDTEYPHFQGSVESPEDVSEPRERHPVFYGCFDWHSAVHSHWCLVRQLRLFDDHPEKEAIIDSIERRFTAEGIQREAEYLEENPAFEKPYGWVWLLRLGAELSLWESSLGNTWQERLEPLESTVRSLVETEFLTRDRPIRVGTHGNSAFALTAIADYAQTVGDQSLATTTAETARRFYMEDASYPVEYEPLGWDFVSPALTEADLMRRVLNRQEFVEWVEQFFPELTQSPFQTVLEPLDVEPSPDDGVATHLIGLNISKAWCLIALSEMLADHRYGDLFAQSAKRHVTLGLEPALTDDYAGSHWLSSFVLYLLTRDEGGIGGR